MVSIYLLSILAGVMVVAIIGIIYFVENVMRNYVHVFFTYFALIMMALMLLGAIIYLYSPSELTLGIAVGINMVFMIVILGYFFAIADEIEEKKNPISNIHRYFIALMLVINEALMGTTFTLAQFGNNIFSSPLQDVSSSLDSIWFFYPMMIEMLSLFIIAYVNNYDNDKLMMLIPFIGITSFPPLLFNINAWKMSSIIIDIALGILGFMKSEKNWKLIYSVLILSVLTSTISLKPVFCIAIAFTMVYYYFFIFEKYKIYTKK
ncbi:hypothetical protein [Acidianus ambivalens]|uniref:Uncharacterized protein n=1 Tax=Acidianus ambivalens TaxID=2283 RepID=A0A650CTW1_ACIAM|nr:hypothetical protein [Acidianus ambivalens]MQL56216.1 hypothetical protein [Acidianus ambivalens]QGR21246.1 hypothetical protein D1866_03945 [Acidianus ambivalens]